MIERLEFASCYAYSPRGTSNLALQSQTLCMRIKAADAEAFRLSADRVAVLYRAGHFTTFFGSDVALVPVPGRAPLAPGAVSRSQQICMALVDRGLAGNSQPLIERTHPVRKSAYAAPGERPTAQEHFETFTVYDATAVPRRVLLVDDVVTRGATFLGAASRIREGFPETEIRAFALVRTESYGELTAIQDPPEGHIELLPSGVTVRRP